MNVSGSDDSNVNASATSSPTLSARTNGSKGARSLKPWLSCLLSLAAILGMFGALAQADYPVILFIRSFHNPLLEQIGDMGYRLGHGVTLVAISGALFGFGYWWQRAEWRQAGWDSLFAHVIAGLGAQIPKHLVGRPRPRFTHQDPFQFGPSLQGGFDTFPSGHSSATFAVAAVLAKVFPRGVWVWYGAALFVAMTRIARGSHFPTDVMGGALFGYLVGYVWARPLKDWKSSAYQGLCGAMPFAVVCFSIIWLSLDQSYISNGREAMILGGCIVMVLGLGLRMFHLRKNEIEKLLGWFGSRECVLIIALGAAIFTQSVIIILVTILAGLGWWFAQAEQEERPERGLIGNFLALPALIGALWLVQNLKGIIPIIPQ